MTRLSSLVVLFVLIQASLPQPGGIRVSYQSRTQETLRCDYTGSARRVEWRDRTSSLIFEYTIQFDNVAKTTKADYVHFNYTLIEGSSFNLIIQSVKREDAGDYTCARVLGDGTTETLSYTLIVEAAVSPVISVDSVVIGTELQVISGNNYTFTCSAVGARSVNPLQLMFSFEGEGSNTTSQENQDDPSLTDYMKTAIFSPERSDIDLTTLSCSIIGYNQVTERDNNISRVVSLVVQAPAKRETTLSPSDRVTTIDTTSTAETASCTSKLITSIEGDSCTGLIAIVAVESVIIVILSLFLGWSSFTSRKNTEEAKQGSVNLTDDSAAAHNSAYMDLQERNHDSEKERERSTQIPVRNVKMISDLPGCGLVAYKRAILTTNSGAKDAVVKLPADNGSIKLGRVWCSEVSGLQSLPKNANVVKILGWCNSVPYMLVFDYINGGNLKRHLTENFSSHKVHQYGNTKQKRFEVPETGRVDNLPRFALDVARGIKFLLFNKFIHPGLRAQKVLLDEAGRCKIYDFITITRAKDLTSLLWVDSAPYQWLPPEFLFLDTIAAPGDVWSFSVLLWEIYSYGSQPYPEEDRRALEGSLREKKRLPMPRNCPGAVWQLMNRCWDQSAEMRPTIDQIAANLAAMCNDDKEYDLIPANTTTV